jgi:hypothetical protein
VAAITRAIDAINGVRYAVIASNSQGKPPEPPKPEPRPITPLERAMKRADFERRQAAHNALVARVLPKKRPPESPVH